MLVAKAAPVISPAMAVQTAQPVVPAEGSSGAMQTEFGHWFADLGAVDGGQPTAAHTLLLRFTSNTDALLAGAVLSPVVDGVRLLVRNQNGSTPVGPAPQPDAVARFVARMDGITDVQANVLPDREFVVTSDRPDTNARLDWILRSRIDGLRVRWQTSGAA